MKKETNVARMVRSVLISSLLFLLTALHLAAQSGGEAAGQSSDFRSYLDTSYLAILAALPREELGAYGLTQTMTKAKAAASRPRSEAEREAAMDVATDAALSGLLAWNREGLSQADKLDYDAYKMILESERRLRNFPYFNILAAFPSPMGQGAIDFLLKSQTLSRPEDIDPWIAGLRALPAESNAILARVKAMCASGYCPPRIMLTQVAMSIGNFIDMPPSVQELARYFKARLDAMPNLGEKERRARTDQVAALIADEVYPNFRRIKAEIESMASKAPNTYGLFSYPGGRAAYEALILNSVGEELTARHVQDSALASVEAIGRELAALGPGNDTPIGKGKAFLASETISSVSDPSWVEGVRKETREILPRWFPEFPASEPEFRYGAGDASPNYLPPNLDGSRKAIVSFPAGYSGTRSSGLEALWHEWYPGHALQLGLQRENGDLPIFRRLQGNSAFIEGWATYATELMEGSEPGKDPYYHVRTLVDRYGLAVDIVIDTGLNGLGWSYDQAYDFARDHLGISASAFVNLVTNTLFRPGYLMTYYSGYERIIELRDEAKALADDSFDLRVFHGRLLSLGSLPFALLRRELLASYAKP